MLMRTESISDSLVAMLGSCSSSPHHLSPPGVCGGCIDRSQTCCAGKRGFNAADFVGRWDIECECMYVWGLVWAFMCSEFSLLREFGYKVD